MEYRTSEALGAGVNYMDTAYFYLEGQSEEFLGRCLAEVPRERYYLATKLPCMAVDSLEDARRFFADQRRRLRREEFDFYLLHALNRDRWHKMLELGVVDDCIRLQREGKIRRLGFSFHGDYAAFEEILTARRWDFCQIQLNYLDTEEQAGMRGYRLAEGMGVPVVVMEPVKGGALANLPEDLAQPMRDARPDRSVASWAVRWAAQLPGVLTVLSGMSSLEQVEDNLSAFTPFEPLSPEETALLERVAGELKQRVNNGCTGCRYCMPCPAGVDIPKNFEVWNVAAKCIDGSAAWRAWNVVLHDEARAKNCIGCGRCESLCPQGIPIRSDLARAQMELDRVPRPMS